MKTFIKYIYIIGIFWLMSFWSQEVFAQWTCPSGQHRSNWWCVADFTNIPMSNNTSTSTSCKPDQYTRTVIPLAAKCMPKLCIWHSDGYCLAIGDGSNPATVIATKKNECLWKYYDQNNSSYKQKWDEKFCKCISEWGTELAVWVPFVWWADGSDRCVPKSKSWEALPLLMWVIIQILNTLLLVWWFAMLVRAGVLYTTQDVKWAKKIMRWVFGAFALYWSLGLILRLINPVLFG